MEKNKLAIILLGKQNSGKTSTIKYFDKKYDEYNRNKKYCKKGWRHLQLFKEELGALFSLIYFIPASPSETNFPLKDRLKEFKPELLLVAEQENGKEYENTIQFLDDNNYEIEVFNLQRIKSANIWNEWTKETMEGILDNRATTIRNTFKSFILRRIK